MEKELSNDRIWNYRFFWTMLPRNDLFLSQWRHLGRLPAKSAGFRPFDTRASAFKQATRAYAFKHATCAVRNIISLNSSKSSSIFLCIDLSLHPYGSLDLFTKIILGKLCQSCLSGFNWNSLASQHHNHQKLFNSII